MRKLRHRGVRQRTRGVGSESNINPIRMNRVIMMLLHSATNTHIQHFQTRSYSEHVALGAYYQGIVGSVDSLVETLQGLTDSILKNYPLDNINFSESMAPLAYMEGLRSEFSAHRDAFPKNGQVQNILDGVGELLDGTVYKLRFLR